MIIEKSNSESIVCINSFLTSRIIRDQHVKNTSHMKTIYDFE